MPILLLLLLTLACLPDNWQSLTWDGLLENPWLGATLTWSGVASLVAMAATLAFWTRRRLLSHPEWADWVRHRYHSWRYYHSLAVFGFYGLSLFLLGWGWAVQSLGPVDAEGQPQMFPAAELLILAPFLVSLVLCWAFFYDAERALHSDNTATEAGNSFWGRWTYVGFHLRQNLALICVPVGLLILEKALRRCFAGLQSEWAFQASALVLLAALVLGLPWVLRVVLNLRPMPEGPLRDRLLIAARRLKFRCSNLLLWNTHGQVANAMVAGLVPSIRYVVLTDRLANDLTLEEIEAVFGHEVGHVKHRHMVYYLAFLLISLAVLAGLWDLAASYLEEPEPPVAAAVEEEPLALPSPRSIHAEMAGWSWAANSDLAAVPLIAVLGAYIFLVFGFLSRRCERQADIFGCRAVSCTRPDCAGHDGAAVLAPAGKGLCPTGIRTFIDALEKVARLNGIHRKKPGLMQSWQHSTIARRVEFLQRMLADPTVEARFQRRVGLVKLGLMVGLITLILLLYQLPGGWPRLLTLF